MSAALDFTYLYPFASDVVEQEKGVGLRLATCGAQHEHPYFFEGRLRQPRAVGDMLLVLSDVVRTHFFVANVWALRDPVVPSSSRVSSGVRRTPEFEPRIARQGSAQHSRNQSTSRVEHPPAPRAASGTKAPPPSGRGT
jgi:hypothetical protein